jgi:hypothetical protein
MKKEREMINIVPVKKNLIFLILLQCSIVATSVEQSTFSTNSKYKIPIHYPQIYASLGILNRFFTTTLKRDGVSRVLDLNNEEEKMPAPVTTVLSSTEANLHQSSGWSIT